MDHITNRVFELRKEINVTQEDLAKAVNVSRQTIIAIEKGNYIPSLLLGLKIARFLRNRLRRCLYIKNMKNNFVGEIIISSASLDS